MESVRNLMKLFPSILFVFFCICCFGQSQPLFKITTNNKVGYINQTGKVIIPPVYFSGDDFSNGLAAVRLKGLYGYIDDKNQFVIKPQYDFATKFYHGFALAYKDGDTIVINKQGLRALPGWCRKVNYIGEDKLEVKTRTGKAGCFDMRTKKLCIDTVFSSIGEFKNGIAVAYKYTVKNDKRSKPLVAVINTSGKLIVAFGKYDEIRNFVDGYALVSIKDKKEKADGLINQKGRLLFKRPHEKNSYLFKDFHDGLAVVDLYKHWIPEQKGVISTSDKAYEGYINLNGEVLFNDTTRKYLNNFSCKRAFIKNEDNKYYVIDTNLRKVGHAKFSAVLDNEFKNGYALVRAKGGWGVIDTNANFVVKPQFDNVSEVGIVGDYFFFYNDSEDDKHLYGIADLHGNVIVKPIMQNFDPAGFLNGLTLGVIENKLTYIDKKGAIIWQDKPDDSTAHQKLNIDYMNRGYFYAYSKADTADHDDEDGWAAKANISKEIDHPGFGKNNLAFYIDTNYKKAYQKVFSGYQLFVANTTGDTVKFNAQDGRLYLKLQARNSKGEWKDIEYTPNSWCGNSYHRIKLEPGNYWSFTIPQYDGAIKTQVRAELTYVDAGDTKKSKVIYSNAISGGVNPGQFWNKRQYTPGSVMDPYYE